MNRLRHIFLTVLAMFFMVNTVAFAENTPEQTSTDVVIYVVNYPPQVSMSADGTLYGEWIDKIRDFMDQTDLNYEISNIPWQRSYLEATTKDNVLISNLDRTIEREDQFHWLLPMETLTYSMLAFNRPDLHGSTLEQILNGTEEVTCLKAASTCDILRGLGFAEERMWEFSDFSGVTVSELLLKQRASLVLDDFELVSKRVNEFNLPQGSLISLFDVITIGSYLAASKNMNPEILEKLIGVSSQEENQ